MIGILLLFQVALYKSNVFYLERSHRYFLSISLILLLDFGFFSFLRNTINSDFKDSQIFSLFLRLVKLSVISGIFTSLSLFFFSVFSYGHFQFISDLLNPIAFFFYFCGHDIIYFFSVISTRNNQQYKVFNFLFLSNCLSYLFTLIIVFYSIFSGFEFILFAFIQTLFNLIYFMKHSKELKSGSSDKSLSFNYFNSFTFIQFFSYPVNGIDNQIFANFISKAELLSYELIKTSIFLPLFFVSSISQQIWPILRRNFVFEEYLFRKQKIYLFFISIFFSLCLSLISFIVIQYIFLNLSLIELIFISLTVFVMIFSSMVSSVIYSEGKQIYLAYFAPFSLLFLVIPVFIVPNLENAIMGFLLAQLVGFSIFNLVYFKKIK